MFKLDNFNKKITMNEGDFGIIFTIILDEDIQTSKIKFMIYKEEYGEKTSIIQKDFTQQDVSDHRIEVSLTEQETAELEIGNYLWELYQYLEGQLKNTLVVNKSFIVEEGA